MLSGALARLAPSQLRTAVTAYLSAKEKLDAALSASVRRLYGRFSSHFALWHKAVLAAAELDCTLALATVSCNPGMSRPRFVADAPAPFLHITQGVNICVQAALGGATCIPNDRCQQQPLRWWPFSPSKLCAPSTDPCFADSYCQVGLSSCPSQVETQPVITGAGVDVRFSNLPHRVVPRSDYLYLTMDR